MKDNSKPNLMPLFFVIAGSCLLALPGAYGAFFLFMFATEEGGRNPLMLLLPLPPIICFSLLFGYIWTAMTKRFVGWLWSVSFLFNLIITIISLLVMSYVFMEGPKHDTSPILFFLFAGWTTFVTVASAHYFRLSRAGKKVSLP
ncbi:MAG TPA: hypothetical protein VK400_03925 [Pyrinomonadaceae bacterium]|nr:hypothetical protein [Pyrinomonadaceae bacterium]